MNICNNKKAMAIPIVLCVVLCFGCYIVSLSWSMSNSRTKFQKNYNNRKAYFMARSAIDHLLFKIKTMQCYCYDAMLALENSKGEERALLNTIFQEDILIPSENKPDEKYGYRINKFNIESVDLESSYFTIKLEAVGKYNEFQNKIERLVKISR